MDSLKTIIIWPIYTLKYYITILIGLGIIIFPLIFKILTQGIASIIKYTDLFLFLSFFPFGKELFTSIIYLYAPYSTNICIFTLSFFLSVCLSYSISFYFVLIFEYKF